MGRVSRLPPFTAAVVVAEALDALEGPTAPKSSFETSPSALRSGATMDAILENTS